MKILRPLDWRICLFPSILSPSIEQWTERAAHLANTIANSVNTWKLKRKMYGVYHGSSAVSLIRIINSLQQDEIKKYLIKRKQREDSRAFVLTRSNFKSNEVMVEESWERTLLLLYENCTFSAKISSHLCRYVHLQKNRICRSSDTIPMCFCSQRSHHKH